MGQNEFKLLFIGKKVSPHTNAAIDGKKEEIVLY